MLFFLFRVALAGSNTRSRKGVFLTPHAETHRTHEYGCAARTYCSGAFESRHPIAQALARMGLF
jgi:hypothetical protein